MPRRSFLFLLIFKLNILIFSKRTKPGEIAPATANDPTGIPRGRYRTRDAQRSPRAPLRNIKADRVARESLENPSATKFHCNVEWHLARLDGRYTGLIYSLAYRIAGSRGSFYASAISVAEYLNCHRNAVLRSFRQLEQAGWFVVRRAAKAIRQSGGRFAPAVYQVLSHKELSRAHPGECAEKETFPWSGEEFSTRAEQLGQALYQTTGFRFTSKELYWLRDRAKGDDAEILRRARTMLKEAKGTLSAKKLVRNLAAGFEGGRR
jgi:hypothetical protein